MILILKTIILSKLLITNMICDIKNNNELFVKFVKLKTQKLFKSKSKNLLKNNIIRGFSFLTSKTRVTFNYIRLIFI